MIHSTLEVLIHVYVAGFRVKLCNITPFCVKSSPEHLITDDWRPSTWFALMMENYSCKTRAARAVLRNYLRRPFTGNFVYWRSLVLLFINVYGLADEFAFQTPTVRELTVVGWDFKGNMCPCSYWSYLFVDLENCLHVCKQWVTEISE